MTLNTSDIPNQIELLIRDYKKCVRFQKNVSRDFVYNTFVEKLVKVLGWDPWIEEDYEPFFIEIGNEIFYGAKLVLPSREKALILHLDDDKLNTLDELEKQQLDMSFYTRLAFLALSEKNFPCDFKLIWFTSVSKNFVYSLKDEKRLSYFASQYEQYDKLNRLVFERNFFSLLRSPSYKESGCKLAMWIRRWESILIDCVYDADDVKNIIDFLLTVVMFSRSDIHAHGVAVPDKNLLENLLVKYYLRSKKEFLIEVDFKSIIPEIFKSYREIYNFRYYQDVEGIKYIDNDTFAKLLGELVCRSSRVFSFDSLGLAYSLLENEELIEKLLKNPSVKEWSLPQPVLSKQVEIAFRSKSKMKKLIIHVDGGDIGHVIGLYDQLEKIYEKINSDYLKANKNKDDYFGGDLFGRKFSASNQLDMIPNIPCRILENNIKIIPPEKSKIRTLIILLINKTIASMEKNTTSDITFPKTIHFVN
ncbi:hypothetical protein J7L67_01820 [bacterium]|nr:hypothetical protein [bacterium]